MTNYLSKKLILIHQSMYEVYTQQEKIQRTEEKRCTVNHVAEFENGTPILKERRFGGILY